MRQILWEIPALGNRVHSFSVMLVIAAFSAVYLTAWRARREKIDPNIVYDLAVWLLTGGFIGARALFVAQHHETIHGFWDIFKVWQGGIVFYGCIMGGLAGSLLYWRKVRFPFWPMADAVAPALAIGIALGRVGCFLNGCCYGGVCNLPWRSPFPLVLSPGFTMSRAGGSRRTRRAPYPFIGSDLCDTRWGFLAHPSLGLLSSPPPGRRGDGLAHGDLPRHAVPHRVAPG